jgi:hypothetical protein
VEIPSIRRVMDKEQLLRDKAEYQRQIQNMAGAIAYIEVLLKRLEKQEADGS